MKLGFDNEKYLKEQSEEILRRAGKYGRLYLEFGGKLINDFHAARCLPGYDPNVKLRLLQTLKDQAEVILCLFSGDIERKKMRADFGISYADDALKLIDDLRGLGLDVRGVVITRYQEQPAVMQFRAKLERRGVRVYYHYKTAGYPADVDTIVSDIGYGKNEYVKTEKPIVVVTAPGRGPASSRRASRRSTTSTAWARRRATRSSSRSRCGTCPWTIRSTSPTRRRRSTSTTRT